MYNVDTSSAKEETKDVVASLEEKNREDPKTHELSNGQAVDNLSDKYVASSNSDQNGDDQLEDSSSTADSGIPKKGADYRIDKAVSELQSYHVVKDICIDETAQMLDKILVEADSGQNRNPFSYNPFFEDGTLMKTEVTYDALMDSEDKKLSSVDGVPISVLQEGIDHLLDVGIHGHDVKLNSLGYNPFVFNPFAADDYDEMEDISGNAFLDSDGLGSPSDNEDPSVEINNDVDRSHIKQWSEVDSGKQCGKTDQKLCDSLTEKAGISEAPSQENLGSNAIQDNPHLHWGDNHKETTDSFKKNDEVNVEDGKSVDNNFTSPLESSESNEPRHNNRDQKDENEVITINVSSEEVPLSSTDRSRKITDDLPLGQILSSRSSEETKVDPTASSARSSFSHQNQADPSLSGPASLSGRINYSGQIPYSGSISLRSESSTTSARSFAFPILQSEWTSSPVKMAKADRRSLRKHRGWRMRIMCCRF